MWSPIFVLNFTIGTIGTIQHLLSHMIIQFLKNIPNKEIFLMFKQKHLEGEG